MLPGFRFLFVAIVLSLSTLVFGFGAAALLRTAHEEFSSLPTRHTQPEAMFAQPIDANRPTLAMLRIDTPVLDRRGPERPVSPDAANSAARPEPATPAASTGPGSARSDEGRAEPMASDSVKPDPIEPDPVKPDWAKSDDITKAPEKVAALTTEASAQDQPTIPDRSPPLDQAVETPAPTEPAARDVAVAPIEAPKPELQTVLTPILSATPASMPAPEAIAVPADTTPDAATSKIATLGGPAVTIEPRSDAKAAETAAANRAAASAARRAHLRRLLRQRRLARLRASPPQPKPVALGFFQPLPTAPPAPPRQN